MGNMRIEAGACLWWALMMLLLPLKWLLSAFAAALFHELCHFLAVRALGGEVTAVIIRPGGAILETSPMEPKKELLCTLAGPLGSLFLLLFARTAPLIALCALVQSGYNLLPIFPLDGGRALRCAAMLICPNRDADALCRRVGIVWLVALLSLTLFVTCRFFLGLGAFLPVLILVIKAFPRKRPCKTPPLRLQ